MQPKTSKATTEFGFVVKAQDYLLYLEGLPAVKINDIVNSQSKSKGLVTALDHEKVEVLMLDRERPSPGDAFTVETHGIQLPLENKLLGRAISPMGYAIDGKPGLAPGGERVDFDLVAPGVDCRRIRSEEHTSELQSQ